MNRHDSGVRSARAHPGRPSSCLALALALATLPAHAQVPDRHAALTVAPAGHWSLAAVRVLDAARLTEHGFDPAAPTLTVGRIADLLAMAAGRAEASDHPLQLQVLDWLERLRAEYPDVFAEEAHSLTGRVAIVAGGTAAQNPLRPRNATGLPRYEADTLSAFAAMRAGATLGGRVHVALDAALRADGLQLREAYATSRVGSLGLWAGRRRSGIVSAAGGGMVLNDAAAWDGGGVWLTHPLRLPLLGPVNFETFLAAADSNGLVPEPWFWATRGTLEPLPRFTIGITRAIPFGDTSGGRAINWREFGKILVGLNSAHERDDEYADNQVVAVDGRWRLPSDPAPLELYVTWGAEDSSGAWWKSPAIIGGIFAPVIPGAPAFSAGIEHAVFTGEQGHGHFYEHGLLTDGWVERANLIGHPLGGTGREWLLYGGFDRGIAGPALRWQAFRRVRPQGNRLSPTRQGTSWGGAGDVAWHVLPAIRLHAHAAIEVGSGWKTGNAAAYLVWHPHR